MTSFSNKTEPRHTSILRSVLTSMLSSRSLHWARFSQWLSSYLASTVTWSNPLRFFYGVISRIVCTCPPCHVIYHSCDKGSWRQSLLSTARCCNVWGRNLITGLTSAATPRVDISSTHNLGRNLGCLSFCWHAPLRRDRPDYCTAEVGNPGRTYELPCILPTNPTASSGPANWSTVCSTARSSTISFIRALECLGTQNRTTERQLDMLFNALCYCCMLFWQPQGVSKPPDCQNQH